MTGLVGVRVSRSVTRATCYTAYIEQGLYSKSTNGVSRSDKEGRLTVSRQPSGIVRTSRSFKTCSSLLDYGRRKATPSPHVVGNYSCTPLLVIERKND